MESKCLADDTNDFQGAWFDAENKGPLLGLDQGLVLRIETKSPFFALHMQADFVKIKLDNIAESVIELD